MLGGELFYHIRSWVKFSEDMAKFYLAQIILAFEYLHQRNVIYRDLKPENVLVDANGYIKITDFGLSKNFNKMSIKVTDSFVGTAEYFAPEVINGEKYSKAVDFWCIGVLLFEMLTGDVPFKAQTTDELF